MLYDILIPLYLLLLLDALKSVSLPAAEVHISDVAAREDFRQISYIRQACGFTVFGHGTDGYLEAIDYLAENTLGRSSKEETESKR